MYGIQNTFNEEKHLVTKKLIWKDDLKGRESNMGTDKYNFFCKRISIFFDVSFVKIEHK